MAIVEISEQQLWANALPSLAYVADSNGTITFTNSRAQAYTGRSAEALLGSGWLESVHPDDRERVDNAWRRAVEKREAFEQQLRIRRHDGKFRWHLCRAEPVADPTGSKVAWFAACLDIQSSRSAREVLRESQKQFIEIVDRVPIGIGVADSGGRILYLNPAALRLHGFESLDQMLTRLEEYRDLFELHYPDGRLMPVDEWPVARAMRGEYVSECEARLRRVGLEPRVVTFSTVPVRGHDEEGPRIIFVMHDVTERHRSEAALRASEARLQAIIDNSPLVLYIKDLEGRYLLANRAYLRLFDTTNEQLMGITDYERFPRDVADAYRDNDNRVIESGVSQEFEESAVFHGETRTYLSMKFPLCDERGQVYAVCGISTDITDHKREQQELLETDRRKDEFLSMLAHELRNPLAPIANAVQLLSLSGTTSDHRTFAVEVIDRQVKHLTHLVDDLLDIARINTGRIRLRREVQELGELVRQAVENARPRMAARSLDYSATFPDEPLWLVGDASRIVQVVDNLLDNAAKYTPPGGTVRLELRRDGSEAVLTVSDTGIGIEEADLSRIFQLFEQAEVGLDHAAGGLGLGLNLVKRLVEKHGGSVSARSAGRNAGSEFTVRLPLTDLSAPAPPKVEESRGNQPRSGARRILVVEDNADAAATLRVLLETLGHYVVLATNGTEGISLAADLIPEVVLLDLGLPDVDGYEVAEALRARFGSGIKLIALTGYGQKEHRDRTKAAGFDAHLVKPPSMDTLVGLLMG